MKADGLAKQFPNASCCDCGREVAYASEDQMWAICNEKMVYCPKCAEEEGISSSP